VPTLYYNWPIVLQELITACQTFTTTTCTLQLVQPQSRFSFKVRGYFQNHKYLLLHSTMFFSELIISSKHQILSYLSKHSVIICFYHLFLTDPNVILQFENHIHFDSSFIYKPSTVLYLVLSEFHPDTLSSVAVSCHSSSLSVTKMSVPVFLQHLNYKLSNK